MATITIKGHTFPSPSVKDSSQRRALQAANTIIRLFRQLGLTEDDVDVPLERIAIKNVPATVSWWIDGQPCQYSYSGCNRFVENLMVIQRLLEIEIGMVVDERKPLHEFIGEFAAEEDLATKLVEARQTLGLNEDEKDLTIINKAYKQLAKEHHPDMHGGDDGQFKAINRAHKLLKRELS